MSIFHNTTKTVPVDAPKTTLHTPFNYADRRSKISHTWGQKRKHSLDIEHVRSK